MEGAGWLEAFLAAVPPGECPEAWAKARAEAMVRLAYVIHTKSDYSAAKEAGLRALEACRAIGYRKGEIKALRGIGLDEIVTSYDATDEASVESALASAEASFNELKRLSLAEGDRWGQAEALAGLAMIAFGPRRDYPAAESLVRSCLAIRIAIGDASGEGWSRYNLAELACARGDGPRVRAELSASMEAFTRADDSHGRGFALQYIASCDVHDGLFDDAAARIAECEAIYRRSGNRVDHLWTELLLAMLRVEAGDAAGAKALLEELGEDIEATGLPTLRMERAFLLARARAVAGDEAGARAALEEMRPSAPGRIPRGWLAFRHFFAAALERAFLALGRGDARAAALLYGAIEENRRRYYPFIYNWVNAQTTRLGAGLDALPERAALEPEIKRGGAMGLTELEGLAFPPAEAG